MAFFRQELAIDLGTANTVIFNDDQVVLDDDSCFCKWCGNPVEEIPWIEVDGIDSVEMIPFMTFWREHGKMSVYKHFDEKGCLHSCILFESQDK